MPRTGGRAVRQLGRERLTALLRQVGVFLNHLPHDGLQVDGHHQVRQGLGLEIGQDLQSA